MNKIEFLTNKRFVNTLPHPEPANKFLPKWFVNMPLKANEDLPSLAGNVSMKSCPGIIDAFSMGYVIPAWCDFSIRLEPNGKNSIETNWKEPMIEIFPPEMSKKYDFDSNDDKVFIRIITPWTVKTSEGTSTLITNPKWRPENVHKVYEGIVDSDKYWQVVHFVLVMKKFSTLEIKKGDPLLQIIPFERSPWKAEVISIQEDIAEESDRQRLINDTHIIGGYRKEFWQEKVYK